MPIINYEVVVPRHAREVENLGARCYLNLCTNYKVRRIHLFAFFLNSVKAPVVVPAGACIPVQFVEP